MDKKRKQLIYDNGMGAEKDWLIKEQYFDSRFLGKCESVFCQGNGYLGLRNALEEEYPAETRNMFVAGVFNRFHDTEVTELANIPDITRVKILINQKPYTLMSGTIHHYERTICLGTGEVIRRVDWESPDGERVLLSFYRFVSMADEHALGARIEITPISGDQEIKLISGIDGTVTNSGTQHWVEGEKRLYEGTYMELLSQTSQSKVLAAVYTAHKYFMEDCEIHPPQLPVMTRRHIAISISQHVKKGRKFVVEKLSCVHTTRDLRYLDLTVEQAGEAVRKTGALHIRELYAAGYHKIMEVSKLVWADIWKSQDIKISSRNSFDQLAIRFALYHLNIMMKKDDSRVGIGAKALSGEGYKGHSFWDTEIFLLPYYLFTQPRAARTLLEYRYHNLFGARKKALDAGYQGAMYPWEAAWVDDGEVTPVQGPADIATGKPLIYWTGLIEQHITADVAYAVWQYYEATHDEDFMTRYGYEILLETARFWNSRLEWSQDKKRYEINGVIGPDEYKEHINNNAFTNYMAHFNLQLAMRQIQQLKNSAPHQEVFKRLNAKLDLLLLEEEIKERLPLLYLPLPDGKTNIIPQFEGYLDLERLDISKYKESSEVLTIYQDFSQEQINHYQISKQGDLVVLFFLMSHLFDEKTKLANFKYYEERTLHDSSLSMSTHSVVANELGLHEQAYHFYQGAARVDLGEEMSSSDAGIHSASMGGIWQAAVQGFGGARMMNGSMHIDPSLPQEWEELRFPLIYEEASLEVCVRQNQVTVINKGKPATIILCKNPVRIEEGGQAVENLPKQNAGVKV